MSRKWLCWFLVASPFVSGISPACERIALPPVQANLKLTVFEGIVTAHFAPKTIPGVMQPAPGLVVKITTTVSNPVQTPDVEVFPLADDISCESRPRDREVLTQQYPVGAAVAVLGRALPTHDSGGAKRAQVVSWPEDLGGVARVTEALPRVASGFLDFNAFRSTYEPNSCDRFSLDVAWRNTHRSWYEDYEFLRCLIALRRGVGSEHEEDLLSNMAHYSRYSGVNSSLARQQYRALLKHTEMPRHARKRLLKAFDSNNDAR